MQAHEVKTPGLALAYLTDCTLATVADMAMKKSRNPGEYIRQALIAQCGVSALHRFDLILDGSRAYQVLAAGGVSAWAADYECGSLPKTRHRDPCADDSRSPEQALAYMADCCLATVEHMALLKSRPKQEYIRQISIAQSAVDWILTMDVEHSKTRVTQIREHRGNVKLWAAKRQPPHG